MFLAFWSHQRRANFDICKKLQSRDYDFLLIRFLLKIDNILFCYLTSLRVCVFTVDLSISLHTLCISSDRLHSCIPSFVLHSFDCNPQNQPQPSRVNLSWKTLNVIRDVMRGLLWQATLRRIFLDMQSLESLIKGGK